MKINKWLRLNEKAVYKQLQKIIKLLQPKNKSF